MDFELPEDLREIQRSVREFCESEGEAFARAWDETGAVPVARWCRELGQLGVMGIAVPEEYGGAGMGALAVAVVVEEVARHDGSLALTVASHNGLGTGHILRFGNRGAEAAVPARRSPAARSSPPGRSPRPGAARTPPACRPPRSRRGDAGC